MLPRKRKFLLAQFELYRDYREEGAFVDLTVAQVIAGGLTSGSLRSMATELSELGEIRGFWCAWSKLFGR
jgi:hypothetical protein